MTTRTNTAISCYREQGEDALFEDEKSLELSGRGL